jgi:hypothetical protein
METALPLLSYLPLASVAIAAGGLAVRFFWPSGPAKQTLIAACFIFLLLMSGLLWQQQCVQQRQMRRVANEIVTVIGNDKRTYDDILFGLRRPNYALANAAIDLLVDEERIGSEGTIIVDKSDRAFQVRLYFVRTFQ